MDACKACSILLQFIQYRTHNMGAKTVRKLSAQTFYLLNPSLTIKHFSTFLQTISEFFPCVIYLNNMFSSHSTPQISHNTLNSRDGSNDSIVLLRFWLAASTPDLCPEAGSSHHIPKHYKNISDVTTCQHVL